MFTTINTDYDIEYVPIFSSLCVDIMGIVVCSNSLYTA